MKGPGMALEENGFLPGSHGLVTLAKDLPVRSRLRDTT
jgi:hypothetical protein